jgi:hypothetical protein
MANQLGYDPVLTIERFTQMCWFVSHIPASEFLGCAFAMDPLDGPGLDSLNEVITRFWIDQISHSREESQVIINAATFCHKLANGTLATPLAEQLKKRPRTRSVFQSIGRHLRRGRR